MGGHRFDECEQRMQRNVTNSTNKSGMCVYLREGSYLYRLNTGMDNQLVWTPALGVYL